MANREDKEVLTTIVLSDAVAEFVTMKTVEQKSPKTIRFYKDNLKPLVVFLGDMEVSRLDSASLNRYLVFSQTLPGNVAHQKRFVCLRAFLNHLVWMGYLPHTPLRAKMPKVGQKVISPCTEDEVRAMLVGASHRDEAIIMTLVDAGIRLDELTKMKLNDLDFKQGTVFVTGKGAKERYAPISISTQRVIYRYLTTRKSASEYVWLSEEKKPLTKSGVQQIIRRISKRTLGKTYGPHKFRHTAACAALLNGMPVESLMKMLGHANIRQSLEYAEYVRAKRALIDAKQYSYVEKYLKGGAK